MTSHSGQDVKPTIAMCFGIWFILMLLLVATYLVGMEVDAGKLNFVIAFGIALVKATLIILFFMGIAYSQPLVRLVAASGFFFMVIMLVFTFGDFETREKIEGFPKQYPPPEPAAATAPAGEKAHSPHH